MQSVHGPLIATEEDGTTGTDPHDPGPNTGEEGSYTMAGEQIPQDGENALLFLRQHDPCLEHIQGRRDARGHGTRYAPVDGTLSSADFGERRRAGLLLPSTAPALERLPQRELYDSKGHLAHDGDAPAAVQLAPHARESYDAVLSENRAQRPGTRSAVLTSLRTLLDDLRRYAYSARGDLAQARGSHVFEGFGPGTATVIAILARPSGILVLALPSRARQQVLHALVCAEEEGGARRGPDEGGPDASIHAAEAAGGEEAGARLEAGLERVEGEKGEIDCRARYAAGQEGRGEGGVGWWHCHGRGYIGILGYNKFPSCVQGTCMDVDTLTYIGTLYFVVYGYCVEPYDKIDRASVT